jgi:hypothetical protein
MLGLQLFSQQNQAFATPQGFDKRLGGQGLLSLISEM